jgi:hypothetical protein
MQRVNVSTHLEGVRIPALQFQIIQSSGPFSGPSHLPFHQCVLYSFRSSFRESLEPKFTSFRSLTSHCH